MKAKISIAKRSINSKQVIERFNKEGIELSESDAEEYLDLLYFLAEQVVKQNFLPGNGSHKSESDTL